MSDDFASEPIRFDDTEFDEEKAPKLPKPDYTRSRTSGSKTKAKPTPPYKTGKLVEPFTIGYGFFGMGVGWFEHTYLEKPHMPIGTVIVETAEQCANSWDKAAQNSPAVRRVLYKVVESSTLTMVGIAHAPIVMAVLNEVPATQRLTKRVIAFLERTMRHDGNADDSSGQTYSE
jgi:hypothetical protein